jgi:hypothetical protein
LNFFGGKFGLFLDEAPLSSPPLKFFFLSCVVVDDQSEGVFEFVFLFPSRDYFVDFGKNLGDVDILFFGWGGAGLIDLHDGSVLYAGFCFFLFQLLYLLF